MTPSERYEMQKRRLRLRRALVQIELAAAESGQVSDELPPSLSEAAKALREIAQGILKRKSVVESALQRLFEGERAA